MNYDKQSLTKKIAIKSPERISHTKKVPLPCFCQILKKCILLDFFIPDRFRKQIRGYFMAVRVLDQMEKNV